MPLFQHPAETLHRIVHARSTPVALYVFALLEAAFLPIPIEAVIVPYMELRRDRIWQTAAIALAGYVTVALISYAIGAFFLEEVGEPLLRSLGWAERMRELEAFLGRYGFWAMIVLALTPLPTQVGMIAAGAFGVQFPEFLAAAILARGARNFGVALLVYRYGDRVVHWFTERSRARRERRAQAGGARPSLVDNLLRMGRFCQPRGRPD